MSKITKVTNKKPVKESLSYLIESELEKAEIVLSAKGVTDKVSKMASDLTKIEAEDILPMLDTLTTAFGPDLADQFKNIAVTNLRQAAEAVTAAKTAIDVELAKLEAILNGEPAPEVAPEIASPVKNDMATGGGLPAPDAVPGDEDDLDLGDEDDTELPDFGDDMDDSFAGRARKESVEGRGRVIAETELRGSGSDAVILRAFRSMIKEGASSPLAARSVARHYGIDVSDVVSIVKEAFEAGKRFPLLHKNGLMSKNSKKVNESKKSSKLKEDTTPPVTPETPQLPNPSDIQKAKTLATKIKTTAPGGTVPLQKVGDDIQKNIGSVGKGPNDISAMSPLVTKELDSMGAIKEGDDESPVSGGGQDAFASWLENRHNTLMSKVMGGSSEAVDEECEASPVPEQKTPGDTGPNELMSKSKGRPDQKAAPSAKGPSKAPFSKQGARPVRTASKAPTKEVEEEVLVKRDGKAPERNPRREFVSNKETAPVKATRRPEFSRDSKPEPKAQPNRSEKFQPRTKR